MSNFFSDSAKKGIVIKHNSPSTFLKCQVQYEIELIGFTSSVTEKITGKLMTKKKFAMVLISRKVGVYLEKVISLINRLVATLS